MAAEQARSAERRLEKARALGDDNTLTGTVVDGRQYTFELFVAMAILTTYRDNLLEATDFAELFTFVNGFVFCVCFVCVYYVFLARSLSSLEALPALPTCHCVAWASATQCSTWLCQIGWRHEAGRNSASGGAGLFQLLPQNRAQGG